MGQAIAFCGLPRARSTECATTADDSILFITWRLAGSLPALRADLRMPQQGAPVPFVQQDERLARSSSGPFWLRDPRVASMLQQALRYGETPHNLYFLHAWVR